MMIRLAESQLGEFARTFAKRCNPYPGGVKVRRNVLPLPLPDMSMEDEYAKLRESRQLRRSCRARSLEVEKAYAVEVWTYLAVLVSNSLFLGKVRIPQSHFPVH